MRNSYGSQVRTRSAENIADEIEIQIGAGANFIYFADDNFTSLRNHVISLCGEIRKRKLEIDWAVQARIDEVDYELLKIMKDSGCKLLIFGVESGSSRIICLLNKTITPFDWIDKSRKTFEITKKVGIDTCALFIIGSPTETKDEAEKSIELSRALNPDMIKVHFFVPYAGSAFYPQLKDKIKKESLDRMHHYAKPLVNLSNMSLLELSRMYSKFYKSVLLKPPFIFRHIGKYFFYYIRNYGNFLLFVKSGLRILINN